MTQLDRRQLLKTTGAGAGLAIGAGTTSTGVLSSDVSTSEVATVSPLSATADTARFAVDEDEFTEETFEEIVLEETPITLEGEILENGRWVAASEDVEIPTLVELLQQIDIQGRLVEAIEDMNIPELSWEDLEEFSEGYVQFWQDMPLDGGQFRDELDALLQSIPDEVIEDLAGTAIGLSANLLEDLLYEGLEEFDGYTEFYGIDDYIDEPELLPTGHSIGNLGEFLMFIADEMNSEELSEQSATTTETDEDFWEFNLERFVSGLVAILGEYTAEEFDSEYDTLDEILEALEGYIIEMVEELEIQETLENVDVDLEVDLGDLNGRFDPREGDPVLASLPIRTVHLRILEEEEAEEEEEEEEEDLDIGELLDFLFDLGLPEEFDFELEIELTTGESGDLTGSFEETAEGAAVTFTNNEFDFGLDEFADGLSDEIAEELDAFDLDEILEELDAEALQEAIGTEDTTEEDFEDMVDAINDFVPTMYNAFIEYFESTTTLDEFVADLMDDEEGRHAVELDVAIEFDDINYDEDFDQPPILVDGARPPQDLTNEGLFGDIDGDGFVDIIDTQLLFGLLGDMPEHGRFLNFSRANEERVTVFDVQAHYTLLQNL